MQLFWLRHRNPGGLSKEPGILNVLSGQDETEEPEETAPGCASPSRRIAAGTAGKRQEVQGEEEQWGFSLMAANKTI